MKPLSPKDTDILVIGHGISGLSAASFLASKGKRVIVVGSGTPWTALSTSCFAPLIQKDEDAKRALSFLRPRLEMTGLPLSGGLGRQLAAITHLGSQLSCSLTPKFSAMKWDDSTAILGLIGHPDVDSDMVARNLVSLGMRTKAIWISLPGSEGMPTAVQFAQRFDKEAARYLEDALDDIEEETVLMPPLFPLKSYVRSMKRLQTSKNVRELVTPLSLPGLRLQEAVELISISEGVELLKEREAVSIEVIGREAVSATLSTGIREQSIGFSNLVIASGDITLSGARSSHLSPFQLAESISPNKLHRALGSGIKVHNLRATSREGAVLRNVFVCGASIPGNNFVMGSGMIGALGSSWKVSKLISGGA